MEGLLTKKGERAGKNVNRMSYSKNMSANIQNQNIKGKLRGNIEDKERTLKYREATLNDKKVNKVRTNISSNLVIF